MPWERLRRLVLDLLSREMRRPRSIAAPALLLVGCMGATSPRAKLDETVQETNMAVRFGRTDIASENVAPEARKKFAERHRMWGSEVRVVDWEFGGVEKSSNQEAVVVIGFSWYRPNDGVLRSTSVRQTWKNDKGVGPWFLYEEERVSGDIGLLGEPTTVLRPERKNVQFETTVIK